MEDNAANIEYNGLWIKLKMEAAVCLALHDIELLLQLIRMMPRPYWATNEMIENVGRKIGYVKWIKLLEIEFLFVPFLYQHYQNGP